MYSRCYQHTHDIDWFLRVDDYPVHLASNGGIIPDGVYTVPKLRALQQKVSNMPENFDYRLNLNDITQNVASLYSPNNDIEEYGRNLIPQHLQGQIINQPLWMQMYAWSFIQMSQRGFYSFDKKEESYEYFLVSWPVFKEDDERLAKMRELTEFMEDHNIPKQVYNLNTNINVSHIEPSIANLLQCPKENSHLYQSIKESIYLTQ